ncbi:hypothetical protein [Actinacidiphila yeochonensis]|uniref:hypothetical protein n=1 Tax=Actinacidiphila yeochonensis TaxID=89050 RepID=UPI0005685640|nr:hypothetical protein [Actinacidiphila yeochonensis]
MSFSIKRRGYDPREVDIQVERLRAGLGLAPDFAGFMLVRRGYDRDEVDRYLASFQRTDPS